VPVDAVRKVFFGVAVCIHLLVDDAGIHRPVLVGQPAQRRAAAGMLGVVDVVFHELGVVESAAKAGAEHVVDESRVARGEADDP
jgi:hypothetical protein